MLLLNYLSQWHTDLKAFTTKNWAAIFHIIRLLHNETDEFQIEGVYVCKSQQVKEKRITQTT